MRSERSSYLLSHRPHSDETTSTNRLIPEDVSRGSSYDEQVFRWLWLIPLATYGVGDIVTTITPLRFTDAVNELNGLITVVVESFGLPGFVALKLFVFLACLGISLLGATWEPPVLYRVGGRS